MNYLSVLQLIPTLIEVIKVVEAVYPNSGQGKSRLELVIDLMTSLNANLVPLIPQITSVVGVLVSFLNKIGVFETSPQPTTVGPN